MSVRIEKRWLVLIGRLVLGRWATVLNKSAG